MPSIDSKLTAVERMDLLLKFQLESRMIDKNQAAQRGETFVSQAEECNLTPERMEQIWNDPMSATLSKMIYIAEGLSLKFVANFTTVPSFSNTQNFRFKDWKDGD